MSHVHIHRFETVKDRTLPVFAEAEHMFQRVQQRAFELFAKRGFGHGQALEDWLSAERELCWPAAEVADNDKEYVVSVALPGFEAGEIQVTAAPRELIVHAQSRHERTHTSPGTEGKLTWSTSRSDGVSRRIELPADVRAQDVKAAVAHGLLTIVAPKAQIAAKWATGTTGV
jgi:HSP20 family molecular chaperone IbpA